MTYVVARYSSCGYAVAVGLGANLVRLREQRGLNQSDLARMVGVAPSRIWDWETKRYGSIALRNVMKLAIALQCSMDLLLYGENTAYDVAARTAMPTEPVLSEADREAITLLKDAKLRRLARALSQDREMLAWMLNTPGLPEEESTTGSTPDLPAVADATHQTRDRDTPRGGGKPR